MDSALNRAIFDLTRNGTDSHSVNTASATGLIAGAAFTPTPGTLLVALVYGAVTTDTPSGWTLPTGGEAVNNGGAYLFHRISAAGSGAFSLKHNDINHPVMLAVYEFAAGAALLASSSATNLEATDPNPALTGLAGTSLRIALKGGILGDGLNEREGVWTGASEDFEVNNLYSATPGYFASVAFLTSDTPTWQATCEIAPAGGATREGISLAISLPSPVGNSPVKTWDAATSSYVDMDSYAWDATLGDYVAVDAPDL